MNWEQVLKDSDVLWGKLSQRSARIAHVLRLLAWDEARLRSAVEAAPGAFELVSLRGCGCRRYHIGGEFYSHIRRAQ